MMQVLISCANVLINCKLVLAKISKTIGVLGRIRNNLTVDAANKVHQSFVLPVMDYCDVAWSSMGKENVIS